MAEASGKVGTMKILILHGWTYSTDKWADLVNLLSKKNSVELLKIPGLTQKLDEVWNLDNYVNWLNEKVDSGKSKVVLIGHSNGGRISLSFAAKYPEKVANLILIDSAGIYHNELPIRLKRLVFKIIAKFGSKITKSQTLRKALYKLLRERDYENATPIVKKTMVNLINSDITSILGKIKTPTLIIWGRNDKITPLQDGHLMHKLIHNSKLEIIEDAKHSPQFSKPRIVAKIIYDHI